MISGIYKISFIDGTFYIGSSKDIHNRWKNHLRLLRRGAHHNDRVQRKFKKFGMPKFRILIKCEIKSLIYNEQKLIDTLRPNLNLSRKAGRMEHCEETLIKMSKAMKGRSQPIDFVQRRIKKVWTKKNRKGHSLRMKRLWNNGHYKNRNATWGDDRKRQHSEKLKHLYRTGQFGNKRRGRK